ncbi:TetR family transcriptional regulator [Iamia sp. SCSIO 61187]|uniref:TetR/AcrR family transcriptional regulator n=1 Tax=Iamia sp. SCSIO 61187 TaxID=2722752 RepID=UPI001C62D9E7|nr:TetR family transcriptional regulator [Iamia sp. SCSIO 61187]QYG94557.1 TetR family transcriptional regulator [Iamia sp. SCSIO 61187]
MADTSDPRRLTAQGRERRLQLIEAASELFAERGYDDTRIVDIVERAGVAKGLFYWYFENKEALFRDLVLQNRLQLRRAQAAAIDVEAEPLRRIRQGAEASVVYMANHSRLFSLIEVESVAGLDDVLRQGTEEHARDVAALVTEGIADGTVRDEDPMLLAYGVVGAVGYYGHFQRTGRVSMPIEALAAFVGRFVVCSLAADERIARRVLAPA